MKVTLENKKGLKKNLKVFVDKKTIESHMNEKYKEYKNKLYLKDLDQEKYQKKFSKDNLENLFMEMY